MKPRRLKISPGLDLPLEFATEGVAVIGMRGSGKSNTEARFAEVLYDAGIPFVVIDPKGDWSGLRSSGDGKSAGLSIPVFGGLHGDFPLDPGTGARIADLLVDENLSAVLDVSGLSKTGGLPSFLTAFCKQLMHRHQLAPQVRTVILEEAHRYIPQSVTGQTAALKEAAASLLLEGRAFGLGCWAATQRPARLHKDVLEEVGNLIVHRIGVAATNDKRTIAGWVKHYELAPEIVDSLTSLAPGEAWVLIPDDGLVSRVQIDRRRTYDSAATPTVGAQARRPATMADIDADAIQAALADVIEKAEAEDPKVLQKRIRELEAALAKAQKETATVVEQVEVVPAWVAPFMSSLTDQVAALGDRRLEVDQAFENLRSAVTDTIRERRKEVETVAVEAARTVPRRTGDLTPRGVPARIMPGPGPDPRPPKARNGVVEPPVDGPKLKAGARRMLEQLAQFPGGLKPGILSARAKVKRSGGSWSTYLSALRTNGYVEETNGLLRITDAGLVAAGGARAPMSGADLLDDWRGRLKAGARRMLDVLVDAYPEAVSSDELAAKAEIERSGGSWSTYLSLLRSNDLMVEPERGWHRAADAFFEQLTD